MSEGKGNGPRVGDKAEVAVRGWAIVSVEVVWECGGRVCGVWRYTRRWQESSPEQHEEVTGGHMPRRGEAGYTG